jgi:hypothetical protein
MTLYSNGSPTPTSAAIPPVKQINGKKLARQLKAGLLRPDFQARLAYDLQTGHVAVTGLTAKQARQLTGARCADLAHVWREMRSANRNGKRVLYRSHFTDSDVAAAVRQLGLDRVWAVLDRHTQPQVTVAVE